MDAKKLKEILEKHAAWLNDEEPGERADLRGCDLRGCDLREANLRECDLSMANLSMANLSGANLSMANLSWCNLIKANLRWANLSMANLSGANLSMANLSWCNLIKANLRWANLSMANLSGANLSGTNGLVQTGNFMESHFERNADGYIAYKTFGAAYDPPTAWKIEPGATIEEVVNFDRCSDCGSGINVAPLEFVKENYKGTIWKVLIRWEWLCGVCVPYISDGRIRCEKVELLGIVEDEKK